jgi:phenylpyruvate tautomerase PptA (4-oxalocrotonate tautomerase family)
MPLLQFDTSVEMTQREKRTFADTVREHYSEEMLTGTGHVTVVVRPRDPAELSIGREATDGRYLFLDAEIRRGRSTDRKRAFALAVMDEAADSFGVPEPNMKVVFTEHAGESMMGYDRIGGEWNPEDETDDGGVGTDEE